MHLGQQQK